MLKIQHPGAIVRDREKQVTSWEGVRLYKYANGVECQVLIGQLPHGHLQSAISANRPLTVTRSGTDATIVFGEGAATLVDFLSGERVTAETNSTLVLDPCAFVPSAKVSVQYGDKASELAQDGQHLVASFDDGTTVKVEPHGNHGHVEASRDGQAMKLFFNSKDGKLYVFDAVDA